MDTPLRHQYLRIKRRYPDAILLFRLGDFYESFDDDARIVSQVCDIVLTSRPVAKDRRVPMAGVPYHAVETYVARLLAAGYKVAVCDQLSEPGRGLVERDVVRVITPGTVVEPTILPAGRNNYIAAVLVEGEQAGLAYADVSTGEFATTELCDEEALLEVQRELSRLQPAELLLPEDPAAAALGNASNVAVTRYPAWHWREETARQALKDYFGVERLEGFGCEGKPLAIRAAGALLQYLQDTQQNLLRQIRALRTYSTSHYMTLDPQTRRNLELTANTLTGEATYSLLWVLDQTRTPMGARLLRRWLNQPLLDIAAVNARLDAVELFVRDTALRTAVRDLLSGMRDIERTTSRILSGIAGPRELLGLRASLEKVPALASLLEPILKERPASVLALPDPCTEVAELIGRAISEEAPATLAAGGVIRPGFSAELDQIVSASREAREWIASLEEKERKRTGIRTLKVGYNKVFGYYIEVTRALEKMVPPEYIRKQTLVNAERYITPELKEYEAIVLGAQERMAEIEARLYKEVLLQIAAVADRLLSTADALARLDVCAALAEVAVRNRYVRPVLNEGEAISIKAGRHPVVELTLKDEPFIPNDIYLDCNDAQLIVLTGPNMSGKCVSAGTLVFTDRGIVPIASLSPSDPVGGFLPLQIGVKGKNGPEETSHFYTGGYQRTVLVRTQWGFEIEGTPDHRIWCRFPDGHEGWKALGEMQKGDVVAIDPRLDLWGSETEIRCPDDSREGSHHRLPAHLTPDLAYIMGLLVGKGRLSYKGGLVLSNSEPSIQADFRRIVQEQFGYTVGAKNNGRDLYISSVQIRRFLAHIGLDYRRADPKYIPPSILRAPRPVVVAFLQGLFDAKGHADAQDGNVSLSTSSRRLAQEVQLVLLNLGIVSAVRLKKTKRGDHYQVTISGIDAIRFYERVGFRLGRKQARGAWVSNSRMPKRWGIPHLEAALELIRARIVAMPNKPVALRRNRRISNIFYTHLPNGRDLSYAKLEELIRYCHENNVPCQELETIQAHGYFYDRVVSLEHGGGEVYDLTVPEGHAFVAHGFVNHNSTYLRQVALIVLMAQIGSFVPADSAEIGLVDRIFTRVGAQDDIATGRSTFMVEMTETANILHHATRRSLIVLDEIGRGTSTYDGLAIARAVLEYIHNHPRLGARTIFATHYHELTEMAQVLPRVRNFNVAVAEEGGKVVFLRKIVPGGADRSYGIHVAQLAGLPGSVIHRAEEVLAQLEKTRQKEERREALRQVTVVKQLPLFGPGPSRVVEELKRIRVEELTPLEAINKLYELKRMAEEEEKNG